MPSRFKSNGSRRPRDPGRPSLWVSLCLAAVLSSSSCSVATAPLPVDQIHSSVADREGSIQEAAAAIEKSGFGPLLHEPLRFDPAATDPDRDEVWHACAWAWARGPATARRGLLAARAAAGSAGAPGPLQLIGENLDFDDPDLQNQVALTFDLLGVFGLGRAGAAARLATAEERRAFGSLEQAVWAARFAVDRARVQVAAAQVRAAGLSALAAEVATDLRRVQILDDRGWLPADQVAAARAMAGGLERRVAGARTEVATRLEALATASGLPPRSTLLGSITARTLDGFDPTTAVDPVPAGTSLLGRLPSLRASRLDYALAEARLQRAAAETWPDLRLGPRLRFTPDTTLVGGVLNLSIPWPGSVSGFVEAAQQRRELAREALENSLVEALATATRRQIALREAQAVLAKHAPAVETGTRAAWAAGRARFAVDTSTLPQWVDRLERRTEGCTAAIDAREAAILARLDYLEALGPQAPPSEEEH